MKKCYVNLFKKVNLERSETNMSLILERVWKEKKNAPKIQIAFAMSICETVLNPNNLIIQVCEEVIKPKLEKNYVSF